MTGRGSTWNDLVVGEAFLVVQVFDRGGYHSSALGRTLKDVRVEAEKRSTQKSIIACSIPFEGRWSDSGIPDVTMPLDFKQVLAAIDKPGDDD